MIIIKKKFGFHNFAEHRLRTNGLDCMKIVFYKFPRQISNQISKSDHVIT